MPFASGNDDKYVSRRHHRKWKHWYGACHGNRCPLLRCWRYAHRQVHKISLFKLNFVRSCLDIEWFQEKGMYAEQNRMFHKIPNDKDTPFWHFVLVLNLLYGNNSIPFINLVNVYAAKLNTQSKQFFLLKWVYFHNLWINVRLSNFVHSNSLLLIESQIRDSY